LKTLGDKIGVFSKTNVRIKMFNNLAFLSQKRQYFRQIFGENISKIITSVPGTDSKCSQRYDRRIYVAMYSNNACFTVG
jgi:hypothetical protein